VWVICVFVGREEGTGEAKSCRTARAKAHILYDVVETDGHKLKFLFQNGHKNEIPWLSGKHHFILNQSFHFVFIISRRVTRDDAF
jgi:hypothetical protein